MHCPFCQHHDSRVIDSRSAEEGNAIRRRRECLACHMRFTTIETAALTVRKRSGVVEPFSRIKVAAGVRKACQGRPVTDDDLQVLVGRVEESLRETGKSQIDTQAIGRAILEPLKALDVVAYLRFASVYSCFQGLDDFQAEIDALRDETGSGVR
ncbi:transcriptional repressor NrdR [Nanchangia anserum]|uniref:Transcriptional repressor NrdR n=1 Tax=Nanchangia anserum TaxID=2692125 RepID=A0A8I0GCK9_9ACTO|nr:transcriptional regulator NrdR [Nanchangia anserum]MBD3690253.1 transcriptional repressor NrdR [Nanchangia anserum]QOX82306.1 transcriptional repressor NrdR [Nanchangia anserum]